MLGRTFIVILFFWAALTIITPILIRLSASANLLDYNGEIKINGGIIRSSKEAGLSSRRALGSIGRPEKIIHASSPSPSPSSDVHRQTGFELEVSVDTRIASRAKKKNKIT